MEQEDLNLDGEMRNKKNSFLWDYFEIDPTSDYKKAYCKVRVCGKVFTSIYQIKSGNLHLHLKKHVTEYAEMVAKREEWKLQITSKNKQMREERRNRKAEFSNYKCKECNYTGMSQKNLEIDNLNK